VRAVVHGTAGPAPTDLPTPTAGPGEGLVEVTGVLLRPIDHASFARPRGVLGVPGTRIVGRRDGETVAIDPTIPCGRCRHCASGLAAVCPHRVVLGARGRDGGLAEAIAVPDANCHRLPPGLDPDIAVFATSVGMGIPLARRLRLADDAHLSVLGDGVDALATAAALATRHPATRLLSDDPFTAAVAAKWSLRHRGVSEAGRRNDQEAVVVLDRDAAGNDTLDVAAGMLRPRGRLAWCCDLPSAADAGLDRLRWIEGELLGQISTSIPDGLRLLADGGLDATPLLRRRITLEETAIALSTGRPAELDGVLVSIGADAGTVRRDRAARTASS